MVMSFNVGRRNAMIGLLIDNDINTIFDSRDNHNDESLLVEILGNGFKGYENYTDDELIQEMNERDLWNNWFKDTE
jgi:hypothetical protein